MKKQKKLKELNHFFVASLLFLFKFLQISEGFTQVYVCGDNSYGQLGLGNIIGSKTSIHQFTENPSLRGTIQIDAGSAHVLALFKNETVASFGNNINGELGLGDYTSRNTPTLIPNLNNIKSVYAGNSYSIVILNDGTVYVFGDNSYGQLGLGLVNLQNTSIPIINPYLNGSDIQKISLSYHSLILLNDGTVLSFGWNSYGQLGQGNKNNFFIPTLIPNLNNVVDIAVGIDHSLFLLNNGSVLACGDNTYGQLGLGPNIQNTTIPTIIPNLNNVLKIGCGRYFCYTLLSNGSIFSWGYNYYGQLGLGYSSIITTYFPTLIPGINNVTDFSVGQDQVFILLENGTIMGVGNNANGQLGIDFSQFPFYSLNFIAPPILNSLGNILFNSTTFRSDTSYFIQYVPYEINNRGMNSQRINLVAAIVTPIVLLLFILSISFILLFLYFKKRKSTNSSQTSNIELRELIKQNVQINEHELIRGSNRIYKGNYTGKNVVLKKIFDNNINEYKFYEKIERNPNIVECFGIYEYKGERYIILELLNSSLDKYLKSTKNLPIEKLIKFIQQISICLLYLEDKEYIHGNVCCENILRKDNNQLKLCDFEFTHKIYNPLTLSEKDFSKIKFYGPEVKKNRKYDKKSDVWSWSVTCIQIFYLNQQNNEEQSFQMNEQILNSKPPQCPDDLWNLIQRGLNSNPSLRPSFKEIVDFFPKEAKLSVLHISNKEDDVYSSIHDQKGEEYLANQGNNQRKEEYTQAQSDYSLNPQTDENYTIIP